MQDDDVLPAPEAPPIEHVGTYTTADGRTVIYDLHVKDAWIDSSVAVTLPEAE